ncbi:MAG TPA: MBL fold hydrolase [Microscillaceae bacterium]|jgi:metallo-beta-lactamase family protein|nr:MBL fold hydrolase [Microscillaceae bacterium]
MQLTFWGAARQVTGSMFLLTLEDGFKLLIDCGLDMNRSPEYSDNPYGFFPFDPSTVHALILTHAHIDHSGYIPNLIRDGFEGTIYCTAPTAALSRILLDDSASLHQKKLKKLASTRNEQKRARILRDMGGDAKAFFMHRQVEEAVEHFRHIPFGKRVKVLDGVFLTFNPTSHLLGAANVLLEIDEAGQTKKICFSGDIGRKNYPLLPDPQPIPLVDYLICESTYGNRRHQHAENQEEILFEIIQDVCVKKQGRLIIPAFSVGRSQALLYVIHKLCEAGKLPPIKIFSDSPLALQSTRIYEAHRSWLSGDAQAFAQQYGSLFNFENLVYIENLKESKAIDHYPEPCVIISSSGMIQGGRIEHHVRQNLANPNATILMVGFAAEGTFGHELLQGVKEVEFKKKPIPVLARIESIDSFSGHGDLDDLLAFINTQDKQQLKKLFLVHGEYTSMQAFKLTLEGQGFHQVEIPERGQTFDL